MISLKASIDLGQYGLKAAQILSLLGPAAKKDMHDAAATEVVELLRKHIRDYAATNHRTADDIAGGPATRTGHLEKAADSVAKGLISSERGEATISSPGFRRAFGPLRIVPKTKPALTIPMHAAAYGHTVSDLVSRGVRIFRVKRKKDGKEYLATLSYEKKLLVLYALKSEVTLKHAPDMLPDEDQFKAAARDGVLGAVRMRLAKRSAA